MVKKDAEILEHKMTFEIEVAPIGGSGHILVPKYLVGKNVRVTLEVID